MRPWQAALAIVATTFAATAQAATPPGTIVKLPLPAVNQAKLYVISATLKPGMPARDASMGVLDANPNALPGGIRAAAATGSVTSGGKTTFYVTVGINNLGGRSLLRGTGEISELDLDLIYSAVVFNSPHFKEYGCGGWQAIFKVVVGERYVTLGGWSSSPKQILDHVKKKLGC